MTTMTPGFWQIIEDVVRQAETPAAVQNGSTAPVSQAGTARRAAPSARPRTSRPVQGLDPRRLLVMETRSLLTRLARIKSFALYETMTPAASVSLAALNAVESYMTHFRNKLLVQVKAYLDWLESPAGQSAPIPEAQRRFTFLRLRFNMILSHLEIFADVITQRSENETGVWLAGLDVVAGDVLALPDYYTSPPVMCYLDRSHGAAIRRARTRLPGGGENPVAIIRMPRERMVGSGIASSLVHEVGHQAAALLDLIASLRPQIQAQQQARPDQKLLWQLWERWISEIVSDLWAAAKVGIAAPMGLMGVVSLPRAFVFRINLDDPHPIPWIRVKLSCAIGNALYPHPQWQQLADVWEAYYPLDGLNEERQLLLRALEASIPAFVTLLVNHRPASLGGKSLREVLVQEDRTAAQLRARIQAWRSRKLDVRFLPPSLALAMLGQARLDGHISPEGESRLTEDLLTYWALRSTLDTSAVCVSLEDEATAKSV